MKTIERQISDPQPLGATGESVRNVLHDSLEADETVLSFSAAERRVSETEIEQVMVGITTKRLLIVSPSPAFGYELTTSQPRANCQIVRLTNEPDGSMYLVMEAGRDYQCLHFPSSWRREAMSIVDGLKDVRVGPAGRSDVDRISLFQEFAGIVEEPGQGREVEW